MDGEAIDTFLAVMETGTITGAAQCLHVTQATVSKRVGALEDELGYALIERRRGMRAVSLTARGEEFEPLARQWKGVERDMRALHEGGERAQLTVATVDSVGAFALRAAFRSFVEHHRGVKFGIEIHHSDEVSELVERRMADLGFAFAPAPYGDLLSKPIYREEMRVLAPAASGRPDAIDPADLDPRHEIHLRLGAAYEGWYERFWPQGRYRVHIAPASLVPDYLDEPKMWAIVPESVARSMAERYGYRVHALTVGTPSLLCYQIQARRCAAKTAELIGAMEREVGDLVQATASLKSFEPWMLGDANTVIRM